jgi:hypothetical protein
MITMKNIIVEKEREVLFRRYFSTREISAHLIKSGSCQHTKRVAKPVRQFIENQMCISTNFGLENTENNNHLMEF